MEVTIREGLARALFGGVLVAIAAGRVLDEVLGAPFGAVLEVFAGLLAVVAAGIWASEDAPIKVRAADLGALVGIAFTLLIHQLVDQPATQEFLRNGVLGIAFAAFVGATTARATQTANTAHPVVGLTGLGLLFVGVVAGWLQKGLEGLPTALLIGGSGLLVLYVVLDRTQVGETVQSRPFRYGAGAALLVALAAALGVGSYALAIRNDHTWDMTRTKAYSLSDHAIQVAEGLAYDAKIVAFFRGSAPERADFADLVERLQEHTGRLTVEWVDPLQQPLRAKQAEVTGDQGTVILEGNGNERRLEGEITEEELVRALVLLGSKEDHQVCWSLGHGEPDPDDEFSAEGLGAARLQLEGLNYQVMKTQIANTGIPRDCDVLIVARPSAEWFPYEKEALAAYLAEGGRALLLVDAAEVPEFAADLARFGVLAGDDVVIDLNLKNQMLGVADPSFVVLSAENFGQHAITRNLSAAIVMPIARSVKASEEDLPGLEVRDLLRTSPDAWGETDFTGPQPTPNPEVEVVGEVPVMAVVEITDPAILKVAKPSGEAAPPPAPAPAPEGAPAAPTEPPGPSEPGAPATPPDMKGNVGRAVPADFAPKAGGRLVVIGDSDFAANQYIDWGNNRDLFLNSVAWLAEEEDQIGERPPAGEKLTVSIAAQSLWCLLSVVLVPGLTAGFALSTLLYRRYSL